ncbi:hypothetical protein FQR65_LT00123 [Abscondita terminalis]|nr:hypothetical protein FQR65_LT00123 [Abscondita terminalis]
MLSRVSFVNVLSVSNCGKMSDTLLKYGFSYNQLIDKGTLIDCSKVETIKNWLCMDQLPQLTKEQIVLFLISCDDDVDFTKVTIKAYFSIKYNNNDVFNNRKVSDDDVQKALDVGSICVWPRKTSGGYAIMRYAFKSSEYWKWNLKQATKIAFMAIESVIFDYPVQGLIVLIDLKNVSLGHLMQLRPGPLKVLIDYFQDALPVKLISIHGFNSPWFLNQILAIILPFMKQELFEKISFHPKNIDWDNFYKQHVPKEMMCKDYGGDFLLCDEIEKLTIEKFASMKEYFEIEEALRRI